MVNEGMKESERFNARPQWFKDFWGTAVTYFSSTEHEKFLETALGCGKMVDAGNIAKAKEIAKQAKKAIQLDEFENKKGSPISPKIVQMIALGNFPEDLTKIAISVISTKHPEIHFTENK